jgi:hypothetical protein
MGHLGLRRALVILWRTIAGSHWTLLLLLLHHGAEGVLVLKIKKILNVKTTSSASLKLAAKTLLVMDGK